MLLDARLSAERIAQAVEHAGLNPLPQGISEKFAQYYTLLERWNSKLNLTAIRTPEQALRRHFVECIFCAQQLPPAIATLLDYGSGAGFPGIPIALCRPEIRVTLAESQGKKASFLREAVRSLGISAEVYAERVEEIEPIRNFDAVALRAVDSMQKAITAAAVRVNPRGWLVLLAAAGTVELPEGFFSREVAIPGSQTGLLILASRDSGSQD
jgi:16S rRNA (guanine527-N7)-methyltransferase